MKKYIVLSIMLLASGIDLLGMKRKYPEDKIERIDLTRPATNNNAPIMLDLTNDEQRTCDLCLDDKDDFQFKKLSCCGYNASCTDCLLELIQTSLREKNIATIVCPNRTCMQPINEQDMRVITQYAHPVIFEYFCDVATHTWLNQHEKDIKHCPTPDCAYSFINDEGIKQTIKCLQCKQPYCSNCLVLHPQKMSCEQAREFKNKEEAANNEWLQKNTKACPQCKALVEKNGGCLTMKCLKCKHQFCWNCLNPHDHTTGHYPCGLWEDVEQMNQANQLLINQAQPAVAQAMAGRQNNEQREGQNNRRIVRGVRLQQPPAQQLLQPQAQLPPPLPPAHLLQPHQQFQQPPLLPPLRPQREPMPPQIIQPMQYYQEQQQQAQQPLLIPLRQHPQQREEQPIPVLQPHQQQLAQEQRRRQQQQEQLQLIRQQLQRQQQQEQMVQEQLRLRQQERIIQQYFQQQQQEQQQLLQQQQEEEQQRQRRQALLQMEPEQLIEIIQQQRQELLQQQQQQPLRQQLLQLDREQLIEMIMRQLQPDQIDLIHQQFQRLMNHPNINVNIIQGDNGEAQNQIDPQ